MLEVREWAQYYQYLALSFWNAGVPYSPKQSLWQNGIYNIDNQSIIQHTSVLKLSNNVPADVKVLQIKHRFLCSRILLGQNQYFGSGFINFGSGFIISGSGILGLIPIRIQGFDDRKLKKFSAENFLYIFFDQKLLFTTPQVSMKNV